MSAEDRKKMDDAVVQALATSPKNFSALCTHLKMQGTDIGNSVKRLKRGGLIALDKGKGRGPNGTWRLSTDRKVADPPTDQHSCARSPSEGPPLP